MASGRPAGREGVEGPASAGPGTDGTPAVREASAVRETRRHGSPFVLYEHLTWQERFRGLVAGVTAAGPGADFGVGTASPPTRFFEAHASLAEQLGFAAGLVARQVHGARVVRLEGALPAVDSGRDAPPGARSNGPHLYVAGRADGLLAARRGVLLTVTAADCIPVYLVDPDAGVLALLHAGWRGVAAGVLEEGVRRAVEAGADPERLHLHLGPGICGECYEVGPEVQGALGFPVRDPRTIDLGDVLLRRAGPLGVSGDRLTRSAWCTRCGGDRFHSHRGSRGEAGRMAAYLGWRDAGGG